MILEIDLPDNLTTEMVLELERIPCLAKISSSFIVEFENVFSEKVEGTVKEWDIKEISLRAAAGAGGAYTHYDHSQITLKHISGTTFKVEELKMFSSNGWQTIILNGDYAPKEMMWWYGQE